MVTLGYESSTLAREGGIVGLNFRCRFFNLAVLQVSVYLANKSSNIIYKYIYQIYICEYIDICLVQQGKDPSVAI